ncbi:MAG: hypothetical protein IKV94_03510 [Clostridia bacterium]|nr:hypothetical protein [Clostridia bacterium]
MEEGLSGIIVILFCIAILLIFIIGQIDVGRENGLKIYKEVIYVYTE